MKSKLWSLFFIVLIVYGAYAITHTGSGMRMETVDGYEVKETQQTDSGGFLSEIGFDFIHMVTIVKDFFTVLGGGESQFGNGLAVLTGNEEIDTIAAQRDLDNAAGTAEERISGAISTVADTFQTKQDSSVVQQISDDIVLTEAKVVKVIDGDTFYAVIGSNEIKVRLIGVDTPESVHTDASLNTVWGTYASDYTKGILIEDKTVYLEYDEDPVDKYGRTLAYVWLSQDTSDIENMLNAILVKDGYAYDKVFKPNDKYATIFEQLRVGAQDSGTGLWADEGFAALWGGLDYEKNRKDTDKADSGFCSVLHYYDYYRIFHNHNDRYMAGQQGCSGYTGQLCH